MVYDIVVGGTRHGYDVELNFVGYISCYNVLMSGYSHTAHFSAVDSGRRIFPVRRSRLYFDKNDAAAVHGYDVDFVVSHVPVSFDNGIALLHK